MRGQGRGKGRKTVNEHWEVVAEDSFGSRFYVFREAKCLAEDIADSLASLGFKIHAINWIRGSTIIAA